MSVSIMPGQSEITNDGLTLSSTGCFIAVPIWQQWASKGLTSWLIYFYESASTTHNIQLANLCGRCWRYEPITAEWSHLWVLTVVQNGSVLDGLQLWKQNVDKHFEGVEECYICYSVLHGSSYQLPRKQCRTCRKRFHAECLYRWFDTSNNSACPLCRNLF